MTSKPTFEDRLTQALPEASGADKYILERLGVAIEARRRFDALPPDDPRRVDEAAMLLDSAMQAMTVLVGPKALGVVYGPDPQPEDIASNLARLWFRLGAAEKLFDLIADPAAPSSMTSLRAEILAVANGDKPRLLARNQKGVKFRRDYLRLRALGWDAFLQARGMRAGDAQRKISESFHRTWPAIFAWRKSLRDTIGEDNIVMFLNLAASGQDIHYIANPDIDAAIAADGLACRNEDRQAQEAEPIPRVARTEH